MVTLTATRLRRLFYEYIFISFIYMQLFWRDSKLSTVSRCRQYGRPMSCPNLVP